MPQRFLRPGITSSEKWNNVSFAAQSLYVRLLTLVDDYGRYDARTALVRSHAFPVMEISKDEVEGMMQELSESTLIDVYTVDGKEFLQITQWKERARVASRYPKPPEKCADSDDKCSESDNICPQAPNICSGDANKCSSPSPSPSPLKNSSSNKFEDGGSEVKAKSPKAAKAAPSEQGLGFADAFRTLLPDDVRLSANWRTRWASAYDDLIRLDGRTKEQIWKICQWARRDPFYSKHFLSPVKLRQFAPDGSCYFDKYAEAMKAPRRGETPPAAPDAPARPLKHWSEFMDAYPHFREKCGEWKTDKDITLLSVRDEYASWLANREKQ